MSSVGSPLRIVVFSVFPPAYGLITEWIASRGHRTVLLVTVPGTGDGRYGEAPHLATVVGPDQDVLISRRLKTVVTPAVAALAPDLIISATFPLRIPAAVTAIPRYGSVNYHPAPLPLGRGPNPQRVIYDGNLETGATLHRIAPEFDTGEILSQRRVALPTAVTPEDVMRAWFSLVPEVLDEGVARAVAGDPGIVQDHSTATYAAPFTPDELQLRWDEPALTIQRRATMLNLIGPQARAEVDGQIVSVMDVVALPDAPPSSLPPGTTIDRTDATYVIQTSDGAVRVRVVEGPSAGGL